MTSKENIQKELCNMVMRQTTYTLEETIEKLEKHNNDYMKVIKEYMNPDTSIDTDESNKKLSTSINQEIYSQIRHLMDDAATTYRVNKELAEKKALYQNLIKKKLEQMHTEKEKNESEANTSEANTSEVNTSEK